VRILYREHLFMFLEDLAVSGACVIYTSLFRVSILLLAAGSQNMLLWHILSFTPSFVKNYHLLQQLKCWGTQADAQSMVISLSAYHVPF